MSFKFIKASLDKKTFWGLPMAILSIGFLSILSLLVRIIKSIISPDSIIVSADTRMMNLLASFRNADLTQFLLWITLLGKWQIIFVFLVTTIGLFWLWQKRLYILPLLISIVGAEIFTTIGKIIFHRPRPELAIYTEHSFSFPSGHATIAVAFYGFLAYLLIRHSEKWKTKLTIFFIGLAIILLIGFSRLYLGAHYVSDVWGGYLVGALWLIISISISEWFRLRKRKDGSIIMRANRRFIAIVLIILSLGLYILFASNYHPPLRQQTIEQKISAQSPMDIFTNEQLKYTETLTGAKQEPISFIILAKNDNELVAAFEKSGWYLADRINMKSLIKTAKTAILKKQYLRAPITPSFWNKNTHTFGFEKPTEANNVRQRHHARFWKTKYKALDDSLIYVGTASLDDGMKWGITHKINPNIDTEPELILADLQKSELIKLVQKKPLVGPVIGKNFSGDQFFTKGKVYILVLKLSKISL